MNTSGPVVFESYFTVTWTRVAQRSKDVTFLPDVYESSRTSENRVSDFTMTWTMVARSSKTSHLAMTWTERIIGLKVHISLLRGQGRLCCLSLRRHVSWGSHWGMTWIARWSNFAYRDTSITVTRIRLMWVPMSAPLRLWSLVCHYRLLHSCILVSLVFKPNVITQAVIKNELEHCSNRR